MADYQQHLSSLETLSLQCPNTTTAAEAEKEEEYDLVEDIDKITGYRFRNPSLLEQAFTYDSSCTKNCNSFQRLEFFGDSVLNHMVAQEIFFLYPDLHQGKLTLLRAANVDTEKLARVAMKSSFHKYLRHTKPVLAGQIETFKEAILEYPLHSYGLIDVPKVLADTVESFIGAVHIDSNRSWDTTWKVVKNLLQPMITPETLQVNPVTKLYELCQKRGSKLQIVDTNWNTTGEIEVYIDKEFVGMSKYRSKKLIAVNRAADNAYKQIITKFSTVDNFDDNDQNNS